MTDHVADEVQAIIDTIGEIDTADTDRTVRLQQLLSYAHDNAYDINIVSGLSVTAALEGLEILVGSLYDRGEQLANSLIAVKEAMQHFEKLTSDEREMFMSQLSDESLRTATMQYFLRALSIRAGYTVSGSGYHLSITARGYASDDVPIVFKAHATATYGGDDAVERDCLVESMRVSCHRVTEDESEKPMLRLPKWAGV